MREAELVEVVDVGEAEDEGGEVEGRVGGRGGEKEEGDGGGAEEEFFCYGSLLDHQRLDFLCNRHE